MGAQERKDLFFKKGSEKHQESNCVGDVFLDRGKGNNEIEKSIGAPWRNRELI